MQTRSALLRLLTHRRAHFAALPQEKTRSLPGDALVPDPAYTITHAIRIDAPPDVVWPWLVQLGAGRGGWYSYDFIDNGNQPSANAVLARYQRVAPGDVLPALPGATDAFIVARIEPPRDLVLIVRGKDGPVVSWEHWIEREPDGGSRLLVRGRVAKGWKEMMRGAGRPNQRLALIEHVYRLLGRLPELAVVAIAGPGHRVMEARHLRGIKRRAESRTAVHAAER